MAAQFPTRTATDAALESAIAEVMHTVRNPLDYSRRQYEPTMMLFVVHRENDNFLRVSTDGNDAAAQNLPRRTGRGDDLVFITFRSGPFAVARLPGSMVIERKLQQGIVPVLTKEVAWTPEQVSAWREMRRNLTNARQNLEVARRKRLGLRKYRTRSCLLG